MLGRNQLGWRAHGRNKHPVSWRFRFFRSCVGVPCLFERRGNRKSRPFHVNYAAISLIDASALRWAREWIQSKSYSSQCWGYNRAGELLGHVTYNKLIRVSELAILLLCLSYFGVVGAGDNLHTINCNSGERVGHGVVPAYDVPQLSIELRQKIELSDLPKDATRLPSPWYPYGGGTPSCFRARGWCPVAKSSGIPLLRFPACRGLNAGICTDGRAICGNSCSRWLKANLGHKGIQVNCSNAGLPVVPLVQRIVVASTNAVLANRDRGCSKGRRRIYPLPCVVAFEIVFDVDFRSPDHHWAV